MPGKIDSYVKAFATLWTDRSRQRWAIATNHRAPHKPALHAPTFLPIADIGKSLKQQRHLLSPTIKAKGGFTPFSFV
jgi:hypothetical protein